MEELEQKKTTPYARYGGQYTMLFRGGHRANHRRLPDVTKMKWDDLGTGRKKKDRYDQYVDDDSEEEEQTEKKEANEEVNFDLTQDMPSFDRNTRYSHPSVDQPYRPFQYKRGARSKNHVDRYFMKNKRYERPLLNDDETRVFIPTNRKGMIIGRRHAIRVEIEEQFDVTLNIAMGECDDKVTPVIIIGSSATARAACKEHIEGIISGLIRKPPSKVVESSSSSSEDESEEEVEDERPERQTTTDSDGDRPEERARPTKQHIRKILYKEISTVRKRDATEITEWRKNSNDIKVSFMSKHENKREYKPCLTFREAFWGFPRILDHLEKQKFDKPSPIQSQLWPIALSGRDTIGISQTGSGKTLAFLAPLVAHCLYGGVLTHPDVGSTIKEEEPGDSEGDTSGTDQEQIDERLEFNMQIRMDYEAGEPMGLIIAPTRELANQIKDQVDQVFGILEKTSYSCRDGPNTKFLVGKDNKRPMTTMLAVGGTERREDITRLQDGSPPTIVIGTPGRLMDLSDMGELKLHKCTYVVLDEADKMLDQGFRGDIEKLIDQSHIPKKRQIIMTSATWPVEIQKFAKQYMRNAIKIIVGKFDLTCVKTVVQSVTKVNNDNEKFRELCKYIDDLRNNGEKVTDVDSDSDDEIVIVAGGDNRNQRAAPQVNNERADSPGPRLEGDSSSDTDVEVEVNAPAPEPNRGGEGFHIPAEEPQPDGAGSEAEQQNENQQNERRGGWSGSDTDTEEANPPEAPQRNAGWDNIGTPWKSSAAKTDEFIKRDWKLMVFCGRKDTVDAVYGLLQRTYRGKFARAIGSMHGDYEQHDRTKALKKLKNGQTQVMVCTDVAARGIDVKDITHVFSYDLAVNIDDHCHRIGRTGRAGRHGKACTLFNVGDNRDLKKADLFWKLLVESTMDGGNLLPESDSQSDTQDVLKKRTINKKYSWLQKLAVRCDAKRSLMLAAKRKF